jgi:hypothetical protein
VIGPAPGELTVTAVQLLWHDGWQQIRFNQLIQGVFWSVQSAGRVEVGWELLPPASKEVAHITVFYSRAGNGVGALVLWNTERALVRMASGEQLMELQGKSIGVTAVRRRWLLNSHNIDPEEVRSELFLRLRKEFTLTSAVRISRRNCFPVGHTANFQKAT